MCEPEQWVNRYGDLLYSYAYQRLNDSSQAEDLVQETFLAALNSMSSFKANSSESTWLIGILKFKIIDFYRSKTEKLKDDEYLKKEVSLDQFFKNGTWKKEARPIVPKILDPIHEEDFMNVLSICLKQIKGKSEMAFRLKYLEDLDTDESLEILEVSTANYWVLMHRAKQFLRKCLEKRWI